MARDEGRRAGLSASEKRPGMKSRWLWQVLAIAAGAMGILGFRRRWQRRDGGGLQGLGALRKPDFPQRHRSNGPARALCKAISVDDSAVLVHAGTGYRYRSLFGSGDVRFCDRGRCVLS